MNIQNIALESTDKVMTSHAGLILYEEFWRRFAMAKRMARILPKKKKKKGRRQIAKVKSLLYSFLMGGDCLDFLDNVALKDAFFRDLSEGGENARRMGEFLKTFGNRHIELLEELLLKMAFEFRSFLTDDKKFVLYMDGTPHRQYGLKMEGVKYNGHKGFMSYDSQNAYDQYGIGYCFDLRDGGTYSGKDSELWIDKIFKMAPEYFEKYFVADSAYAKARNYQTLNAKNVKFVMALSNKVGKYVRREDKNLLEWEETEIVFFDSDDCEIAMGHYPVKGFGIGNLRVVFIRAPRKGDIQLELNLDPNLSEDEQLYDHYCFITNIDISEMDNEEVIRFYRKRANCENFIKDEKYSFDFKHFPCGVKKANQVYGLIGLLDY